MSPTIVNKLTAVAVAVTFAAAISAGTVVALGTSVATTAQPSPAQQSSESGDTLDGLRFWVPRVDF